MNKKYIVKDKILFNEIIKKGKWIKNKYYVIYIMKSTNNYPRFGFAVGKKIGNAVTRNRIKRQLRNIIYNNFTKFKNFNDYIIVAKKSCKDEKYDTLNTEMNLLIKRRII